MLLYALAKCVSPDGSTSLKHGALNLVTECNFIVVIVIIKKQKGEGKCNLARFDVNSVLCFITRNSLGL